MLTRRKLLLSLGSAAALPLGIVEAVAQPIPVAEAFIKLATLMRKEDWWVAHYEEVNELASKAGFENRIITENSIVIFSKGDHLFTNARPDVEKSLAIIEIYQKEIIHKTKFQDEKGVWDFKTVTYTSIEEAADAIFDIKKL